VHFDKFVGNHLGEVRLSALMRLVLEQVCGECGMHKVMRGMPETCPISSEMMTTLNK
jgi:hypothetical protein